MSLGGSTPSPSACKPRDWSKGTTPGFQPGVTPEGFPQVRLPDPALEVMFAASLAERSGAGFPGSTGGFDSRGALSGIG